jgi:hypothetical protein
VAIANTLEDVEGRGMMRRSFSRVLYRDIRASLNMLNVTIMSGVASGFSRGDENFVLLRQ